MAQNRLLFTGATLIVPEDDRCAARPDGWLLVGGDGRIEALGEGRPPAAGIQTVDLRGAFLGPGFVSAHSHLFTSGARGLGHEQTLYGWVSAMLAITAELEPEDIYWCTLHGALDFIGAGVTTAYDFADARLRIEPLVDGQRLDAALLRPAAWSHRQADAKADGGLRFVHSVLLDELEGTEADVEARFAEVIDHRTTLDPEFYLATAISGGVQWSTDPATAALEARLMRQYGVRNQPHFLETREHLATQLAKFAWYDEAGALGPELIFGHFVQATPEIIARAAETGCGMSWQPTANGRLASGVADVPAMRAAGMRVGMGLDDQGCTDLADPWQNLRMGLYLSRAVTGDPSQLHVAEALRLHTLGSAEVIGVDDRVGSLEVGKYADLLVVDPRRPDTGPVWDPIAHYVLACGVRNLRQVWIGGQLASEGGVSTNPLADRAVEEVHTRLRAANP